MSWSVKVPARDRTMLPAPVTIVLPDWMELPPCPLPVLLLLLCLLPLSLGQCRMVEDSSGAEYSVVQQSSLSSEQSKFCLPESVVLRRQGVDYCFTEQQSQGAVFTRTGVGSDVLQNLNSQTGWVLPCRDKYIFFLLLLFKLQTYYGTFDMATFCQDTFWF